METTSVVSGQQVTANAQNLPTPLVCYVDFCLLPIGTSSPSISSEIATVKQLIETSGLKHVMHSAGTTVQGSWDECMRLVGQAHALLHEQGIPRVQTSMRVGTRVDKELGNFEDKVNKVAEVLKKRDKNE